MISSAATLGATLTVPSTIWGAKQDVPAQFWESTGKQNRIRCLLCPRGCLLKPGMVGPCKTRKNKKGVMVTLGYSNPCALHVDPIEKKPLYHVTPGAKALSVAIAGCNLHCKNCQNYTISQASPLQTRNYSLSPNALVQKALENNCSTIAYTYSEPIAWYEYMYDAAKLAKKAGLKNLMITCGYINPEPLKKLCTYMDAANIDLKSFSDDIYKKLNAGTLDPVLKAIQIARDCGTWVEVTNLIVPKWTDNIGMIGEMCQWLCHNVGKDVPLHFSRFSPLYKLAHLYPTPTSILIKAKAVAKKAGLNHVYLGNVAKQDTNTYCPHCNKMVIERRGYLILSNHIKNEACGYCQKPIAGIWS